MGLAQAGKAVSGNLMIAGQSPAGLAVGGVVIWSSFELAINCGGGADAPFLADEYFDSNSATAGYGGGIDLSYVTNPAPMAVYQTCRYLNTPTYTIPGFVANGSYNLRCHFAENWGGVNPGDRVNVITVNGVIAMTVDVLANVPKYTAWLAEATINADSSGNIVMTVTAGATATNPAFIGGFEISSQ